MQKLILIICFGFWANCAVAQAGAEPAEPKAFSKENAFIGGSGTLSAFDLNNGALVVGLSPMYGYFVKKWLDVAVVANFQYTNFSFDPQLLLSGRQRRSTVLGLGVSSRIYPIDFAFLQVQPEMNVVFAKEKSLYSTGTSSAEVKFTKIVPCLLVGAGMKRGFAQGRTFGWVGLYVDVLANKYSPYRNIAIVPGGVGDVVPILRGGINIMLSDLKNRNANNR